MNENAQKWVEALESGEYEQGRGALELDGKLCCLGVACRVAHKAGLPLDVNVDHESGLTSFCGQTTVLPLAVCEWLGIGSATGAMGSSSTEASLIAANDGGGLTFPEIARLIREHEVELFEGISDQP